MKKIMTQEEKATKFNEGIPHFCLNYGNPYIDCGINLICSYRDMYSVNETWADSTIHKTLHKMPIWMVENIHSSWNEIGIRFDIDKDYKGFLAMTIVYANVLQEMSDRRKPAI